MVKVAKHLSKTIAQTKNERRKKVPSGSVQRRIMKAIGVGIEKCATDICVRKRERRIVFRVFRGWSENGCNGRREKG